MVGDNVGWTGQVSWVCTRQEESRRVLEGRGIWSMPHNARHERVEVGASEPCSLALKQTLHRQARRLASPETA